MDRAWYAEGIVRMVSKSFDRVDQSLRSFSGLQQSRPTSRGLMRAPSYESWPPATGNLQPLFGP